MVRRVELRLSVHAFLYFFRSSLADILSYWKWRFFWRKGSCLADQFVAVLRGASAQVQIDILCGNNVYRNKLTGKAAQI